MLDIVRAYIAREIGLPADAHVLVALSGGADSTALLLVLRELGYRVTALHCNFHLRGQESDRDQTFCEALCQDHDIPLLVQHFQTLQVAQERGISLEMAARDLRYEWFHRQLCDLEADCIAVAHHKDDQAETLLLNLLRGAGLQGLCGMHPRRGDIIRPLLCVSRRQIQDFLQARAQSYVTDSTNGERVALRNRLRLDVLPLLISINPSAVDHLCRACDYVRESLPLYEVGLQQGFAERGITPARFPIPALDNPALLHEWLRDKGFNHAQQQEMRQTGSVGRIWQSATHQVLRDREALLMQAVGHRAEAPVLRQEIVPAIQETGPEVAYLDADLLTAPLTVRLAVRGDAFVPFGMKGRKLVSDFLTDRKVSLLDKARQYVVVCGQDIVWLINQRSDDRYRVTAATKRILKLTVTLPPSI